MPASELALLREIGVLLQPEHIGIVRGFCFSQIVSSGDGRASSSVNPAARLDMPVCEREGGRAFVLRARKAHDLRGVALGWAGPERDGVDAVRVLIEEHKLGRSVRNCADGFRAEVYRLIAETINAAAHMDVHGNATDALVLLSVHERGALVRRALVYLRGPAVIAQARIRWIDQEADVCVVWMVFGVTHDALGPPILSVSARPSGQNISVGRHLVVVIGGIKQPRKLELLFVIQAGGRVRAVFGGTEPGKEQPGDQSDDCDDDQHLDQGKGIVPIWIFHGRRKRKNC
jgi:hypothetical protein